MKIHVYNYEMAEPEEKPIHANQDGCVLKCSLGGITGTGTGCHPGTCGKNPLGSRRSIGVGAPGEGM